eukprot:s5678_g3.t1
MAVGSGARLAAPETSPVEVGAPAQVPGAGATSGARSRSSGLGALFTGLWFLCVSPTNSNYLIVASGLLCQTKCLVPRRKEVGGQTIGRGDEVVQVNDVTAYSDLRRELGKTDLSVVVSCTAGGAASDTSSPLRRTLRPHEAAPTPTSQESSPQHGASPGGRSTDRAGHPGFRIEDLAAYNGIDLAEGDSDCAQCTRDPTMSWQLESLATLARYPARAWEDPTMRFSRSDPTPIIALRSSPKADATGQLKAMASLPQEASQMCGQVEFEPASQICVVLGAVAMVEPWHCGKGGVQVAAATSRPRASFGRVGPVSPPGIPPGRWVELPSSKLPGWACWPVPLCLCAAVARRAARDSSQLEDDLDKLRRQLELPAAPRRLPSTSLREMRREDLMTRASKASERLICCRGCGIPLQTHDPDNVGYVRFSNYLQKWSQRLHRKLLCSRCLELEQGQLVPVVKDCSEVMAEGQVGFGGKVVPADVLAQQLRTISKRRCLVVYIVDVLDFNGSFIRKIRQIDLLPPKTKLELVEKWLLYILRRKKLRVVNVKLVSNETGKHINHAVNAIIEARSGMDVFVVGAANAGKSRFITRLLDRLEVKFPQGKVEDCPRPIVSRTPGTTLGTIQLRAFRRSATSPVFASLYDTPGRPGNPR